MTKYTVHYPSGYTITYSTYLAARRVALAASRLSGKAIEITRSPRPYKRKLIIMFIQENEPW